MPFIGQQPITGAYSVLDDITTSATATYNLQLNSAAYSPASANNLLVSLNGVIQKPGSSFTISGSQITFSSALTSSDSIDFIIALGDVLSVGTPTDGSVSSAKLATGAAVANIGSGTITDAKLASTLDLSSKTVSLGTNPMKPIFWAQMTNNQTLSRAVTTKLTGFGTNEIDTNNAFDGTTFTVPTGLGGTYVLQASIFFDYSNAGNDGEHFYGYFYINGSERARFGLSMDSGGREVSQTAITSCELASLSAGDTVELYAYMVDDAASGTLRVLGGSSYGVQFGGFRIG